MHGPINGSLPPARKQRNLIYRVTTAETQQFVIVSRAIFGQNIHWANGRSHECTKDKGKCDGCQKGWPGKWLGYLQAIRVPDNEEVFLELTYTACMMLIHSAEEGKPFNGLQVRISKTKGGPKGRYKVDVMPRRLDVGTLPDEKDPRTTLAFLWACKKPTVQE
jgi:hypothetical protein